MNLNFLFHAHALAINDVEQLDTLGLKTADVVDKL